VVVCFIKAQIEMKLFLGFSFMLFAVSLISPNTGSPTGDTAWEKLALANSVRYWFFPSICFAWSVLWCFRSRIAILKFVSAPLLFMLSVGMIRGWEHAPFSETHLAESVERFEASPPGAVVTIPEYPAGWTVQLVKRRPGL
jgi:hypothetical protein